MERRQTFAAWVEPLARQLAADRRAVIEFARGVNAAAWADRVTDEGWTRHDVLAHLAGGNDMMLQTVLRAVIAGEPLDAAALQPDTDEANRRGVEERRSWTVERLIDELERGGDEMQELLAALRDEHRDARPGGTAYSLGALLRMVGHERHDREHLEQMRAGL